MRKLVQSKKATKILSNPSKVVHLRKAIREERKSNKTDTGKSGNITVRRVGAI